MYRGTAALFAHLQIFLNGAPKLLTGILNIIESLSALLRFPALIESSEVRHIRHRPFNPVSAAEDIGNALCVQLTLAAVIAGIGALGMETAVGYFDRPGGIALRRVYLHFSRTGGAESAGGGPLLPQHQPEIHAFFPSASGHDQLIPEILLSAADF